MSPEAFEATWMDRLESGALVLFRAGEPSPNAFIHSAIADAFALTLGLKPIGFNWELLDANADRHRPRSAFGEIAKALSHDLANPSQPWMAPDAASQCADDFLSLFDPSDRVIVSNRYDGLWHPISGAEVEWGFVGFDRSHIALLLLVSK